MSSQLGGQREYAVARQLCNLGYRCAMVKGSGQRRGKTRGLPLVAGDVLAWYIGEAGLPNIIVEVGGGKKIVGAALSELSAHAPPGFLPLVARCAKRKWFYNVLSHRGALGFRRTTDLIEALRLAQEYAD